MKNTGLNIATIALLSMIVLIVTMTVKGIKPDGAPHWMEKWQITNILVLLTGSVVALRNFWKNI